MRFTKDAKIDVEYIEAPDAEAGTVLSFGLYQDGQRVEFEADAVATERIAMKLGAAVLRAGQAYVEREKNKQ